MKIVIEDYPDNFEVEDSGCAKYFEVSSIDFPCLFVRVHSWDDTKQHRNMNKIIDTFYEKKGIKITIETIENES